MYEGNRHISNTTHLFNITSFNNTCSIAQIGNVIRLYLAYFTLWVFTNTVDSYSYSSQIDNYTLIVRQNLTY